MSDLAVTMMAMALDRLGPAIMRASTFGVLQQVTVPDEDTAAAFRAALAMTARRRVTDRLIEIVVAATSQPQAQKHLMAPLIGRT